MEPEKSILDAFLPAAVKELLEKSNYFDCICVLCFLYGYCQKRNFNAAATYFLSADILIKITMLLKLAHNVLMWMCIVLGVMYLLSSLITNVYFDHVSFPNEANLFIFVPLAVQNNLYFSLPTYARIYAIAFLLKQLFQWAETEFIAGISLGLFFLIAYLGIINMGLKCGKQYSRYR